MARRRNILSRSLNNNEYRYSASVTIGNKDQVKAFRSYFKKKGYKMKTKRSNGFIHIYYKR